MPIPGLAWSFPVIILTGIADSDAFFYFETFGLLSGLVTRDGTERQEVLIGLVSYFFSSVYEKA